MPFATVMTDAKQSLPWKQCKNNQRVMLKQNWQQQWHLEKVIHPRTPWFITP